MRHALGILLLLAAHSAGAQNSVPAGVLSRDAFVKLVLENHPMARQAALRTAMGEASVQSARGGFDPVALATYDEKRFDDKNYYSLLDAGLKVPTWYGVELLGGYQFNDGAQLNPQALTPEDGLLKAGAEVTLGQGLLIDQRRATLRKAQAYQRATEAERRQLLNQLLFGALSDHTDWVAAHEQLRISDTAVVLAAVRLEQVRGSWRGGDRPAVDTLEAYLQWQDRLMRQQQARLNLRNAGLRLSNHLWDAQQRPLELQGGVVPLAADLGSARNSLPADSSLARAIDTHPSLLRARAQLDQLDVDRRYRSELLKPELDVKYQWLGSAGGATLDDVPTPSGEGHLLGVGFKMPLLLRRERGELSLAKLRLTDAELGLERDRQIIRNRVRERVNDITTYEQQVFLGAGMVNNQTRLLNAELSRFNAGEGSLFLVNGREVPLIEARLRQVELEARLRKAWFALDLEAGTLWNAWQN